ncbi:hypothetical protein IO90_17630 [Chryseobacterium sp. FH1]|nr:hypothetical protein IO90_17630 [Chryseobacterium sp. FH1]
MQFLASQPVLSLSKGLLWDFLFNQGYGICSPINVLSKRRAYLNFIKIISPTLKGVILMKFSRRFSTLYGKENVLKILFLNHFKKGS